MRRLHGESFTLLHASRLPLRPRRFIPDKHTPANGLHAAASLHARPVWEPHRHVDHLSHDDSSWTRRRGPPTRPSEPLVDRYHGAHRVQLRPPPPHDSGGRIGLLETDGAGVSQAEYARPQLYLVGGDGGDAGAREPPESGRRGAAPAAEGAVLQKRETVRSGRRDGIRGLCNGIRGWGGVEE